MVAVIDKGFILDKRDGSSSRSSGSSSNVNVPIRRWFSTRSTCVSTTSSSGSAKDVSGLEG